MSSWKDKERGHWRYQFQYRGRICAGRGFDTRREATAEREKRREEVKAEFSKQTQPGTVLFSELSSKYLDFSERKHAKATYKYKVLTFNRFPKQHYAHLKALYVLFDRVCSAPFDDKSEPMEANPSPPVEPTFYFTGAFPVLPV